MPNTSLRVVTNSGIEDAKKAEAVEIPKESVNDLASFLNREWHAYRDEIGRELHERCLDSLRAYKGKYSDQKLQQIKQFGGSEVFSELTSVKCRSATALLRDVFLGAEKVWAVEPTPVPSLPDNVLADINELVIREALSLQQEGQQITPQEIEDRRRNLMDEARKSSRKRAEKEAKEAEQKLDDILTEGKFYNAVMEFLTDLPIFPFACIKGPVIQNANELSWVNGKLQLTKRPRMYWYRVSPLDIYFGPGASDSQDSGIIEKVRISRTALQNIKGLPGYDDEAIDRILEEYTDGWYQAGETTEPQRADLEGREQPQLRTSRLLDGLEWQGPIPGKLLKQHGFTSRQIPDENLDYNVTAWWIGKHVIKAHINPLPYRTNQYYVTCYEKVPGSIAGHSIPEIIKDVQDVANATLRSLVNNLSISSGPQVFINEDRISPNTDPESMYPWKRWRFNADIFGSSEKPIDFFQPDSNAAELLSVYQAMTNIADETSAIPRFLSGSEKVGGAARTASGLSMLINNASKMLQTVASNIDREVMEPIIQDLYYLMMLTDQGKAFRGDTQVVVKGVQVATQQETDRLRKLEFLQLTGNEIDAQIIGTKGRAAILRKVAETLGMPGDDIVPTEEDLDTMMKQTSIAAASQDVPQPEEAGARPAETVEGIVQPRRV